MQKTSLGVQSLQTEAEIRRQQDEALRAGEENFHTSYFSRKKLTNSEAKRLSALEWIYPKDVATRHKEISRLRQEGTGIWLLKKPEFKELENGDQSSSLLWGYGIRTLAHTPTC